MFNFYIPSVLLLHFLLGIECLITPSELNNMFSKAHTERLQEKELEKLPDEKKVVPLASHYQRNPHHQQQQQPNSFLDSYLNPQHINMMHSYNKFTPHSITINNYATTGLNVAQKIMKEKLSNEPEPHKTLGNFKAPNKYCPFKTLAKCDPEFPYRTLDGSCNNLNNVWWGQGETPFKRWLDADYSDPFKLNEPRMSADGSELPNPRDLSCFMHGDAHEIEPFIAHIVMEWGQFVNHDMSSLSISREDDEDKTVCNTCTRSNKCYPIMIKNNETCNCISQMKHQCIELTRSSATFPDVFCSLGKREQLNLQSSFIDASVIYGAKQETLEKLRDRSEKGALLVQRRGGVIGDLMPADQTPKPSDCLDYTNKTRCFVSGDDRVNQNPSLMSVHTMFLREHNRIARILANLNPHWEDENVFQETRRLIIAFLQHITYNEFLPILLGPKTMERLGLNPGKGFEQFNDYNPNVDPRIANEYAAGAGRFGHSLIRTIHSRVNEKYENAGHQSFMLRNNFFRANMLYDEKQGGVEGILRGMLKDPLMKADRWVSQDISRHLFETTDKFGRPFHFDLIGVNIQRGRDHGVPGYNKFRQFCGLPPVKTWTEMKRFVSHDSVELFKQFYRYVDDVDLFVAMLSEFKDESSMVGPTLNCLIGIQFRALKYGDRFWYETSQWPANFLPGQLGEIRKMSLSKLLCRNMPNTPRIQPRAMLSSKLPDNGLVECENLPDINWTFWKDQ